MSGKNEAVLRNIGSDWRAAGSGWEFAFSIKPGGRLRNLLFQQRA
jgi:hypothetical protein